MFATKPSPSPSLRLPLCLSSTVWFSYLKHCMSFLSKVVEELPKVEELEPSDTEVGASFSSDVIATLFSAMVSAASVTIPVKGVAAALVSKRK